MAGGRAIAQLTEGVAPQQNTWESVVTAQVWKTLTLTSLKRSEGATATGLTRSIVVPSPTAPESFWPQQYSRLSAVMPQA
jgi:hypothetical protein